MKKVDIEDCVEAWFGFIIIVITLAVTAGIVFGTIILGKLAFGGF